MSILSERRFVVGENEILELLKRSTCKLCGDPIIPSSITEAEKIAAGIKYKFKCSVSITWMYNAFQFHQLPVQLLNKWSKRFLKLNILVHNLICNREGRNVMFWIISLFLLNLTERSWRKMDFHSVLWREKCNCPPATTDGPSVRRNMGPVQQRCKIYQPCCRINTQILQNATQVQGIYLWLYPISIIIISFFLQYIHNVLGMCSYLFKIFSKIF